MIQPLQFVAHLIVMVYFMQFVSAVSENNGVERHTEASASFHKWPVPKIKLPLGHTPLHHGKQNATILHGNCQHFALFFNTNGLLYLGLHEGTKSHMFPLTVPETTLKSSLMVTSATFAMSNLLLVIEGAVWTYDVDSGIITPAVGIDNNVTDVVSFQCCLSHREWCQVHSHVVVVYNENQEDTTHVIFYISHDSGLQFQIVQIATLHQGHIYGATILHAQSDVAFLIKTTKATARFIYHNYNKVNPPLSESLEFVAMGNDLAFVQLQSGIGSLLIWDTRGFSYSLSSGQAVLPVEVISSSGIVEVYPLVGHKVQEVISDTQGNFALLTDEDKLFFGREGINSQAVELNVTMPCNISCVLYWIAAGHLGIMCPIMLNSPQSSLQFHSTLLNVHEKLRMTGESLLPCPYQAFKGNFNNNLIYVDIGMNVDIQALFIPEVWQKNWFMIGVSNTGILEVTSTLYDNELLATGLTAHTVSVGVDLVASSLPNGSKETGRGISALWMSVLDTSLKCPHNPLLVAQIAADCPPYKKIRVRNTKTLCEEMKSYSYTIARDHYDASFLHGSGDTSSQKDLTIVYDYATLGCPIKSYYGDSFKPSIDLYHDDVFVEEVSVDYVLYEIHGVMTYGYTKTLNQVNCVSAPQSWLLMLKQQGTPDPATAWTRKNYYNCMVNGSAPADLSQPYEVLGNRTSNALHWKDYNTIYVFQVTVVDPDYSFCHLTTQFAVHVYGALPEASVPPLRIMVGTCGLGLGALMAGFIVHSIWGGAVDEEPNDPYGHF